ncbi:hypothetical protein QOT17_020221 [Balamuthia mandrillaris]
MNRLLLVALLCGVVGVLFGSSLVDRVLFFSAPVRVSSLDLEDEVVTLQNVDATKDIDLSGWVLESTVGGGQKYVFPQNYVLKGGSSVKLLSGPNNAGLHNPPSAIYWSNRWIWNNQGDGARLKDKQGAVVHQLYQEPFGGRKLLVCGLVAVTGFAIWFFLPSGEEVRRGFNSFS